MERHHTDTYKAAAIWERRNNRLGAIPSTVVSLLSQALRMGFDPLTACIEVEHHPLHSFVMASRNA